MAEGRKTGQASTSLSRHARPARWRPGFNVSEEFQYASGPAAHKGAGAAYSSPCPAPTGALLLRCQQLLVRRVVTQRPKRREEVHHAAAGIPLGERLLHQ